MGPAQPNMSPTKAQHRTYYIYIYIYLQFYQTNKSLLVLKPKVPATQAASVDVSNQGWWHLSSFLGFSLAAFQDGRPLSLTWICSELRKLFWGSKLSKVQLKAKIQHWWAALRSDDLCCWLSDFIDEGHLVAEAHCHETTRRRCDRFRSRAQIAAMP